MTPSYLYKVVQTSPPHLSGHFYYGIRTPPRGKTPHTDTRYLGSGPGIVEAVEEWEPQCFEKRVLCIGSLEYVSDLERRIVTPEVIERPDCYNRAVGGNIGVLCVAAQEKRSASLKRYARTPEGRAAMEIASEKAQARLAARRRADPRFDAGLRAASSEGGAAGGRLGGPIGGAIVAAKYGDQLRGEWGSKGGRKSGAAIAERCRKVRFERYAALRLGREEIDRREAAVARDSAAKKHWGRYKDCPVIRPKLRPIPPGDRLLSAADVERRTSLGEGTLRRMTQRGEFPGPARDGVWLNSDVTRWMQECVNRSRA